MVDSLQTIGNILLFAGAINIFFIIIIRKIKKKKNKNIIRNRNVIYFEILGYLLYFIGLVLHTLYYVECNNDKQVKFCLLLLFVLFFVVVGTEMLKRDLLEYRLFLNDVDILNNELEKISSSDEAEKEEEKEKAKWKIG